MQCFGALLLLLSDGWDFGVPGHPLLFCSYFLRDHGYTRPLAKNKDVLSRGKSLLYALLFAQYGPTFGSARIDP